MDTLIILIFLGVLVYFIIKRIKDKKKESFEDRDH